MEYVDLRRRRKERARRKAGTSRSGISRDPFFLVGSGFLLGSVVSHFFTDALYMTGASALLTLAATILLLLYVLRLLVREDPARIGPKPGSEKQLLMAVRDTDGVTPVEAALETSLTVDEAEELLTRLADRGHLVVEGRDGVLFYTLPGRRTPEPRTP